MKVCVGCVYEYDWTEPLTATPEGCKGCEMVDGRPSNYKQKPQTNADRMIKMLQENDAYGLLDWWQVILEDGVPSENYFKWWLKQPAEE